MTALFLVGPRGAGKSACGALAADRLQIPFVDTDALVEQRAYRTIAEIFAEDGEPTFRTLEREVMLDLLARAREPMVVSTGGGCVLCDEVRDRLARHPGVILLHAPLATLQARIQGSARPSLTGADPALELERVLALRVPLYRACARRGTQIDTGLLSPEEAAGAIVEVWQSLQRGGD